LTFPSTTPNNDGSVLFAGLKRPYGGFRLHTPVQAPTTATADPYSKPFEGLSQQTFTSRGFSIPPSTNGLGVTIPIQGATTGFGVNTTIQPPIKPAIFGTTMDVKPHEYRHRRGIFGEAICDRNVMETYRQRGMNTYAGRMESYNTYPLKPFHPRPSELAASGFFYLGTKDKVKCHSCNIVLYNWEDTDLAMNEHARWSLGTCAYLNHILN
jgi:hypothetical protein